MDHDRDVSVKVGSRGGTGGRGPGPGYCQFLDRWNSGFVSKEDAQNFRSNCSTETQNRCNAADHYFTQFKNDIFNYHILRKQRIEQYEEQIATAPPAEREKLRVQLLRKETYYLRLKRTKQRLKEYQILSVIGKGGYGEVYLARQRKSNDIVVLKRMKKDATVMRNELDSVKKERDILIRLQSSEWVAKLLASFQDNQNLFFVMEYCPGGDLRSFVQNCGPLDNHEACFYFAEMLLAVRDLHKLGYIHRDLKPGNFVIEHSGHLKLIDFGLSAEGVNFRLNQTFNAMASTVRQSVKLGRRSTRRMTIKEKRQTKALRRFSMVGSPEYMAPEILEGQGYDTAVDYWSLGVLLYEMLVGCSPFEGSTAEEVFENVWMYKETVVRPSEEECGVEVSDSAWDLITKLLCPVSERLGSTGGPEKIMQHQFLSDIQWSQLRQAKPPFVPQLDDELDTSYFDLDNIEGLDIEKMIKSLQEESEAPVLQENIPRAVVAGFTFRPADFKNLQQFQASGSVEGQHRVPVSSNPSRQNLPIVHKPRNDTWNATKSKPAPPTVTEKGVPVAVYRELEGKPWFRTDMNRAAAESALGGCEVGVFVIRPSSQSGCVALSHKRASGTVGHAVIHSHYDADREPAILYQLEQKPHFFPTIIELLQTLPLKYTFR